MYSLYCLYVRFSNRVVVAPVGLVPAQPRVASPDEALEHWVGQRVPRVHREVVQPAHVAVRHHQQQRVVVNSTNYNS